MLSNVRILDATRLLPGPFATWLLAGLGAEVVKVERPGGGDYMRAVSPLRDGTSVAFSIYNAGKRSVALDLKRPEGRAAFLDLVAGADIVFEGNRPGVMDRLGCGWDACRARNPDLVYCAVTGFGQDGPYRERPAHDLNLLALAGVLSGVADERGRPVPPRGATIADMAAGYAAACAALAALTAARAGSGGRFVDVSMLESVLAMSGLRLASELFGERADGDTRGEADTPYSAVYETADGRYVAIEPYEPQFQEVLWDVIEREGVGKRPDPSAGSSAAREALAAAFRSRPRARWDELLMDVDACYTPVYEPSELPSDPQISARKLLGEDAAPRIAHPFRSIPAAPPARATVPACGEDTRELLREAGWSPERIEAAHRAGAVAIPEPGAAAT